MPSISFTQEKKSTTSTGRTDQNNLRLADSNSDSENRSISLEQKIFSGFKGVNTFKKSELETQKAKLQLRDMEQKTIQSSDALCSLIHRPIGGIKRVRLKLYSQSLGGAIWADAPW